MSEQDAPQALKPMSFSPGFLDPGGPYWLGDSNGETIVGLRIGSPT